MCKECDVVKALFDVACQQPHANYYPTIQFLMALEHQHRIELLSGDCKLSEAIAVLETEKHYTVCHYLGCKACGQIFFCGACVRGAPKYKLIDNIDEVNHSNSIWGNIGTKHST